VEIVPGGTSGSSDRYRRRFRLGAEQIQGIYAIVFERDGEKPIRTEWLPPDTEVNYAHQDEFARFKVPVLPLSELEPEFALELGEEADLYTFSPTFFVLDSGEIAACYRCNPIFLDESERRRVREADAELDAPGLERASFHEAGHACAYLSAGIGVKSVSVAAEIDAHGIVTLGITIASTRERDAPGALEFLSRRIACLLAGPMAEAKAGGRPTGAIFLGRKITVPKTIFGWRATRRAKSSTFREGSCKTSWRMQPGTPPFSSRTRNIGRSSRK
jgi:hypothetical protein